MSSGVGQPVVVAAIDCGTNSVRLLVAEHDGSRLGPDRHREMRIVRLGEGVDRTGRLSSAAIERTRSALADYAEVIARLGARRVRMVATSATRDAGNRDEFVSMVRAELGIDPEVVSGADEAALSYAGAASVLPADGRALVVADIGGGSTELVRGGDGPLRAHSMNIGSVRMTERHLPVVPPSPGQIAAVVADVSAAIGLARLRVPLDPGVRLVGVAGTVTTVAALALDLDRYDPDVLDGVPITAEQVRQVTADLAGLTADELARRSVIHPGRRDVILGGALILRTLVDEIGVSELTVSEHDILDGIALSLG